MNELKKNENLPARRKRKDAKSRLVEKLKKTTGYNRKKPEKQKKLLRQINETAGERLERIKNERIFIHNVRVASKHDGRIRRRSRWRFYTFFATGAVLIVLIVYLLYAFVFVVTSVEVSGTEIYSSDAVVSASGIETGTKLFSPRLDIDAAKKSIIEACPYISSVTIERKIPNTLSITVTEDKAVFEAEVCGEYLLLSEGLRALDILSEESADDMITLVLPEVSSAVLGYEIVFAEDVFDVAAKTAAAVLTEEIRDSVTKVDVSDRFNIYVIYEDRYKLVIGTVTDIELKLSLALEMMKTDIFTSDSRGTIYLDDVNKPSIVIDNTITFD
ncbi:MAG: FtsQ-type POTRA domain-containing protein [Firmicutes bacterium]|nr:FtsQ-type POTRA domain-containing protein [Bacillota bacterium]